jgi:hypothetical protein
MDPLGGHDLVNRKNCFGKKKVMGKALLIPIEEEILATFGYLLGTMSC